MHPDVRFEKFKQTAKELSESKKFAAAVPNEINGICLKKFLAEHDGYGVMQVKNSIEKYRKASGECKELCEGALRYLSSVLRQSGRRKEAPAFCRNDKQMNPDRKSISKKQ